MVNVLETSDGRDNRIKYFVSPLAFFVCKRGKTDYETDEINKTNEKIADGQCV